MTDGGNGVGESGAWRGHRLLTDPAVLEATVDRSVAVAQLAAATVAEDDPDRERVLELIAAHDNIADRRCRPGHLTGSALVIDPARRQMLLLFHTKLQRWLQPGGHADGDTNLAAVALREATEETGIDGLRVVVPAIDVDIHEVDPPKEDAHLHLDVRFLVVAPDGADFVGNHESEAMRWVSLDDVADFDLDAGTIRMAERAFAVLDGLVLE